MNDSLLLINACPRERGISRTLALCNALLDAFSSWSSPPCITELSLQALAPLPLDPLALAQREALLTAVGKKGVSGPLFAPARAFAAADLIVIAAPYWDLSYPASLKCYLERICVNGITFHYTNEGKPEGLCRARALVYVTSAGGFIGEHNHGYAYLTAIANMLGIAKVEFLSLEGLDIKGLDPLPEQKKSALRIDEISHSLQLA